jgi:GTP-binding protein
VDLPGYGFARAGKAARVGYRSLVTRYLGERSSLAGVVWLLDVRHDPSKDDFEIQDLLIESGRPVLAALTKSDKLTRTAGIARTRELAAALGLQEDQVQLTSSKSREGIAELAQSILATVGGER